MTAAVQQSLLTEVEARDLTDRIRSTAEQLWSLLLEAHERRAWESLGYRSWSAYIDGEFDMGRRRSYQLLDQARVIREVEAVSGVHHGAQITERDAREVKPHLQAVKDEIRERVDAGEEGHAVVRDVIDRTRDRAREHAEVTSRDGETHPAPRRPTIDDGPTDRVFAEQSPAPQPTPRQQRRADVAAALDGDDEAGQRIIRRRFTQAVGMSISQLHASLFAGPERVYDRWSPEDNPRREAPGQADLWTADGVRSVAKLLSEFADVIDEHMEGRL